MACLPWEGTCDRGSPSGTVSGGQQPALRLRRILPRRSASGTSGGAWGARSGRAACTLLLLTIGGRAGFVAAERCCLRGGSTRGARLRPYCRRASNRCQHRLSQGGQEVSTLGNARNGGVCWRGKACRGGKVEQSVVGRPDSIAVGAKCESSAVWRMNDPDRVEMRGDVYPGLRCAEYGFAVTLNCGLGW